MTRRRMAKSVRETQVIMRHARLGCRDGREVFKKYSRKSVRSGSTSAVNTQGEVIEPERIGLGPRRDPFVPDQTGREE